MDDPGIRTLLERAVGSGVAPGMVARWGRAGAEPRSVVVGSARLMPIREPASNQTWFDLASLTKPLVTTTLILIAFREGRLKISTRVGEVLIEARGTDVGDLDIGQLLTHTSGLPAWWPLYCLSEGDPDRLAERLGSIRLIEPPKRRVVYSCVGFVILGLMLERIFGSPLASIFRDRVTGKLGIEDDLGFCQDSVTHSLSGGAASPVVEERLVAELGLDRQWIPPMAPGLPDDGNARFLGGAAGNAGLFGTATGVLRLAKEFLGRGGTLLDREEVQIATTLQTRGLDQARGLGWQLASSPDCSAGPSLLPEAFGHTGFTGVSVWIDPEIEAVFVLLTNRNHPGQRENDLHPLRRRFHALARESLE
jgi:CubicO group peptidase (beta-lactamase class C family)